MPVPLLIWLPDFALDFVARGAPDFWAWRSGVYEFATEKTLWQWGCASAIIPGVLGVYSLSHPDKGAQLAHLGELLRAAQSLPNRGRREQGLIASLLNQLGLIHQSLGHWEEATTIYQKSLVLFKSLGDQSGIAGTLHEIANIQYLQGELEEAEHLYDQSLKIEQAQGDEGGIARALHQLGTLEQHKGNLNEAERLYLQSLGIEQALGNKSSIARTLHQIASLRYIQGNLQEAERLFRQSLEIKESIGDKHGVAITEADLGQFYQHQGKWHTALQNSLKAWTTFSKLRSPYSEFALSGAQRIRAQVGERQFSEWMSEDFGPQAAEIRRRLDEALSADVARQDPAAVG